MGPCPTLTTGTATILVAPSGVLPDTPSHKRTMAHGYATGPWEQPPYSIDCAWSDYANEPTPCISINAAKIDDYRDGTWEDYITEISFTPTRKAFRAAWRLARKLSRPSGHLSISGAECHTLSSGCGIKILLGLRHKITITP